MLELVMKHMIQNNDLTYGSGFSKYSAGYKSSLADCAGISKFFIFLYIVSKNTLFYNQNFFQFFVWVAHLFFTRCKLQSILVEGKKRNKTAAQ